MVSVDVRTVEEADITLVAATLSGGAVPTRVSVDNRLDGPVWPPRRMGKPATGWDEDGYEGVVPADGQVAIGYACPAPAADPPLEIVAKERVEETDERDADFADADDVLRGLGTPAPPREAVPITPSEADLEDGPDDAPENGPRDGPGGRPGDELEDVRRDEGGERHDESATESGDAEQYISDREHGAIGEGQTGEWAPANDDGWDEEAARAETRPDPRPRSRPSTETAPEPVTAWLDAVEERIERAEPFAEAEDVSTATDALGTVGSLEAARDLEARRDADAAHLREVATRANALAYRAERASIPVDALDRLA